ncbi:NAD(P)/FAD-dependent oxidoreductase [Pontibacillus salicampi]
MKQDYDVVIVGAGASGIGVGSILKQMGCNTFCILEKGEIGDSFRKWPKEMRLITPSFPSQGFGQTDLNAVVPKTSPGYNLNQEHLNGEEFADYLGLIVKHFELPVHTNEAVEEVQKQDNGKYAIHTTKREISSRLVVWATGEFQFPNLSPFPGANYCIHSSHVEAWDELEGDHHIVIGGYESGLDAVYHLDQSGKASDLVAKTSTWRLDSSDPSVDVSPYTFNRIKEVIPKGNISIHENQAVTSVRKEGGQYMVETDLGIILTSDNPPILATGFTGGSQMISHLFQYGEHGKPLVNEEDESIISDGLYLCGPELRHDSHVFCFIYKFRQRFPIVAKSIADKLKLNKDILEMYQKENFYLDDLSSCGERCEC